MNFDIIRLITKYLKNIDTFNLSIMNNLTYQQRYLYYMYNINYKYIKSANFYKIKGLYFKKLDKQIIDNLKNFKIKHIMIENLTVNIKKLPKSINKITINNIQNITVKLSFSIKYLKIINGELYKLDLSNSNELEHLELPINNKVNIIFPKHNIKNFTVSIDNRFCNNNITDIFDLNNFKYKNDITCVNCNYIDFKKLKNILNNCKSLNSLILYRMYRMDEDININVINPNLKNIHLSIKWNNTTLTKVNLPDNITKFVMQSYNNKYGTYYEDDKNLDKIIIIEKLPDTLKNLEIKTDRNTDIYIKKCVNINKLDVLKFSGLQVEFKIESIKNLYLENCEINLNCYKNIDHLYLKKCVIK